MIFSSEPACARSHTKYTLPATPPTKSKETRIFLRNAACAKLPATNVAIVAPKTPSTTPTTMAIGIRSEEHTSELQSRLHLVCRLLLEKKKNQPYSQSRAQSVVGLSPMHSAHSRIVLD